MRYFFAVVVGVLSWMPYLMAQDPAQDVPPQATFFASATSPFPPGMRVIVGEGSVIVRNTPTLSGTCGTDNHVCTQADAQLPNTYGVVQGDPPVLDSGGTFYWLRVAFDTGVTGWVSASGPTRLASLNPPQMIEGVAFAVVGDYNGPVLTQAVCINDGLNSAAQLQLQPTSGGQAGTLLCPWPKAGVGNHKVVIQAVNNAGTAASLEFQFSITTAPIPTPPSQPQNLRIGPVGGVTRLQFPFLTGDKPAPTDKPAPK